MLQRRQSDGQRRRQQQPQTRVPIPEKGRTYKGLIKHARMLRTTARKVQPHAHQSHNPAQTADNIL